MRNSILDKIAAVPPRRLDSNTVPRFLVADTKRSPLQNSPSPLIAGNWRAALANYSGLLPHQLYDILTFGAQIGYNGPERLYIADNLASAQEAPTIITEQLHKDLECGRVSAYTAELPFFCSPLGLVPKHDGSWRRIHHLSHPEGHSVNDTIPGELATLKYTALAEILELVRHAGAGSYLIKKDLKDAFRMIPVAPHNRWLLGFQWQGCFYHENCLPFGLRTAPFIFNLFAEGFHWIWSAIQPWLSLAHYLDDFIAVLPASLRTRAGEVHAIYTELTSFLGLLTNHLKDDEGTTVIILGVEVDTTQMVARLPDRKLRRAAELVNAALSVRKLTLRRAQELAGFLNFCSAVVTLGRTFLTGLWSFIASFRTPAALRPLTDRASADLSWWRDLLPQFNGVRLLVNDERPVYHIFTDASNAALGGFWYAGDQPSWRQALPIPQNQAFFATRADTSHINVAEVEAVATVLVQEAQRWSHGHAVIHTDNTTAEHGFRSGTTANACAMDHIRTALLHAAAADLTISIERITSHDNELADALSRANWPKVANLCPSWQFPFPSSLPLSSSSGLPTTGGLPST